MVEMTASLLVDLSVVKMVDVLAVLTVFVKVVN